jgi:hypothetical protein
VIYAVAQPIQRLPEEPWFAIPTYGAPLWGAHYDFLVVGEVGLHEGVLAVALLLPSTSPDGHGRHEPRALVPQNGGVFFALYPDGLFIVFRWP